MILRNSQEYTSLIKGRIRSSIIALMSKFEFMLVFVLLYLLSICVYGLILILQKVRKKVRKKGRKRERNKEGTKLLLNRVSKYKDSLIF